MVRLGAMALVAVVLAGRPAAAQETEEVEEEEEGFSHKGQFSLHLQGSTGYRALFPYDGEYCGELKDGGGFKANCLGRSPFGFDLGAGYGVLDGLELFLELRLGVEQDIGAAPDESGPRGVALSPGVKLYIGEVGAMMFFSTLQLPIDFTSFDQVDKNDFGVRNVNGFQLDLHRSFGMYAFFGEQVSWRRWLRFEVEVGAGLQARFP
jgi:hypothetical protein